MKVVSFMCKQKKENRNIIIHVKKGIIRYNGLSKIFQYVFPQLFFSRGYFTQQNYFNKNTIQFRKVKKVCHVF